MYGLRLKYPWKLLFGYLNINSLRNKIKNLRKIKFYLQLNYSVFCETKISPSCNLVKYLMPFRLWQPNILFAVGLIIFKIFFLKILTLGRSIFNFRVQFVPLNYDWRKESIFEEAVFNFEMRNIICVPCR